MDSLIPICRIQDFVDRQLVDLDNMMKNRGFLESKKKRLLSQAKPNTQEVKKVTIKRARSSIK